MLIHARTKIGTQTLIVRRTDLHLSELERVADAEPATPDDTHRRVVVVFAVEVGVITRAVPPPAAICHGAVTRPRVVVLVVRCEHQAEVI